MKKIIPAILILLFATTAAADIVYLNNGQWFRADLLRITHKEIYVTIGGITEIDLEKTTIARVEDNEGNLLYPRKKIIVVKTPEPEISGSEGPDQSVQESLLVAVDDPEEPAVKEVLVVKPGESAPMEVMVADPVRPKSIEFDILNSVEPESMEYDFSDPEEPELVEPGLYESSMESDVGVEVAGSIEPEPTDDEAFEPPEDEMAPEPLEPETPESDEVDIAYTPPPPPVRPFRFYTRALDQGSFAVGGLVSFSSVGGDINEGAYGIPNDERRYLFAVAPSVTYFLYDNIGLGGDIMYNREWLSNRFEDQLSLGPRFIYAFPLGREFRPYASAGIGIMQWRFNENERAYSRIGMTVKAGPGLFYFVNENYAVNMELIFKWDRFGTDLEVYPITGNTVLFSIGLSGFIY